MLTISTEPFKVGEFFKIIIVLDDIALFLVCTGKVCYIMSNFILLYHVILMCYIVKSEKLSIIDKCPCVHIA